MSCCHPDCKEILHKGCDYREKYFSHLKNRHEQFQSALIRIMGASLPHEEPVSREIARAALIPDAISGKLPPPEDEF